MLGAPSPASGLLGPMPSRPTLRLKLLGRFWGGEASLEALKPHPVYAESSFLQGPWWLGYSPGAQPPGVPKTVLDCGTEVTTVGGIEIQDWGRGAKIRKKRCE